MNKKFVETMLIFICSGLGSCLWGASEQGETPLPTQKVPHTPEESLSLEKAVRLALIANPELRVSALRVDAAAGEAVQLRTWKNPELELSTEDWPVSDGAGGYSQSKRLVGVTQTVPFPGKKKLDRQIGAAGVELTKANLQSTCADTLRRVKERLGI